MILLLILTVRTINSDKINPLSNKNVLLFTGHYINEILA